MAVPPDTLNATPVVAPMVATDELLLLHEPPGVAVERVVVLPWHTVSVPVIGVKGLTVMIAVATQPAGVTYCISTGPPDNPVTTPVDEIVATAVLPLLQVPPGEALLSVIVYPWHTLVEPVIGNN